MRLSEVQIAIEPRSLSQCSDLAAAYLRVHGPKVYGIVALFAVPSVAIVAIASAGSSFGLLWQALVFLFMSRITGAVLVASVGPNIFGEPLSVRSGLRRFVARGWSLSAALMANTFMVVALLALLFFPGLLIAAAAPFVPEVALLEQLRGKRARARQRSLIAGEYTAILVHIATLMALGGLVVASVFSGIDALAGAVFELPLVSGRLADYLALGALGALLSDGTLAVTLGICAWGVYPWLRLTWFFVYLDVRIRREGWDLELDFRREVEGWDRVEA